MRTIQLDDELEPKLPNFGTKESRKFYKEVQFTLFLKPDMIYYRVTPGPCSVSCSFSELSVIN